MDISITSEKLHEIVLSKDKNSLNKIFIEIPPIDIAEACNELSMSDLIYIFRNVESQKTAPLFDALSQETKESLVKSMTDKELITIINQQAADDIADTVGDMPANLSTRVLKAADKDMREDINQLLKYKDHTAGAIMTTEYLEFKDDLDVDQAIQEVRARGKEAETVYTIFVRSSNRQFIGTVDLDDLIFAKKGQKLSDIMNRNVTSVRVNTDQEEVAQIFSRYDLNALAVLNDDNCLTGIITIDDAVDVMAQEATEDVQKMHAIAPMDEPYLKTSAVQMAKKCVPWIIVLIILGTFSSMVLSGFQNSIATVPILAAFIPVLMDTGGNAGGQTNALMVRGLALKEFTPKDYLKILWKEAKNALIIALCVCAFAFLWFLIEQYLGLVHNEATDVGGVQATIWNGLCWTTSFFERTLIIAVIVSASLFVTVLVSKIAGVSLPIIAAALKKDPALMSEPFVTTIVDVVSLLVYFGLIMAFQPLINQWETVATTLISII
jgi:magnesium transporter